MEKIRVRGQNRTGAGRATLARPQRPSGLRASTVGVVLDSVGTQTIRMNQCIAVLHLAAGFLVMTLGLEDVISGGPTRPMLMPAAGAYMAAAVVFYVVMRERTPSVLAWIFALSDVTLFTAISQLTVLNIAGGPDVTVASIAFVITILYAGYGNPRLSAALGAFLLAAYVLPLAGDATTSNAHVVQSSSAQVSAALLMLLGAAIGYYLARQQKIATLAGVVSRLDYLGNTVSLHKMTRGTAER